MEKNELIDGFGRTITYLRLSLTDRCDLRCLYCMSERPEFMPKASLLTKEEIEHLLGFLQKRGIKKVRLSGGEPLVRRDFLEIAEKVAGLGFDEWSLTTNGTLFAPLAHTLAGLGLKRINVSLDSLDARTFAHITRGGELKKTLAAIEAAESNGIEVKINCVALAGINDQELPALIEWAHAAKRTLTLIETMPMSDTGLDLTKHYLPLAHVKEKLAEHWTLLPEVPQTKNNTAGPARFFHIKETGGRLGVISPVSHQFCESCNRIRISADGKLWTCLGQNHFLDLKAALQQGRLEETLTAGLAAKPLAHNFFIDENSVSGSPQRMMASTGG